MKSLKFIDSHCHVNSFDDCEDYFKYTNSMTVLDIFEYNSDFNLSLLKNMKQSGIYVAAGLHPLSARYDLFNEITVFFNNNIYLLDAIGETGIDLYKSTNYEEQRKLFQLHIDVAKKHNKPVIVHCRGNVNIDEVLFDLKGSSFVFHCFTYDDIIAKKIILNGGYISFSGIITFKKADHLRNALLSIPMDKILCETDSPFLSPEPYRGVKNKPEYVKYVYEKCANILQIDLSDFIQQVEINFNNFLNCK